jgi:hypothetical protein
VNLWIRHLLNRRKIPSPMARFTRGRTHLLLRNDG